MDIAQISGMTRLVPVLGHPIGHVRAPRIYNPAFEAGGLNWCQVPVGVHPNELPAMLNALSKIENLQGLNVTIPHKAAVYELCHSVGPEARRTGVVNTLRLEAGGNWSGENFDGIGFVGAARHFGVLRVERPVLLVGTGDAGTAIAFALATAGVQDLILVNREPQRAERLANRMLSEYAGLKVRIGIEFAAEAGLAVNATSLGLHEADPMPFNPSVLNAECAVFDIIAARDTELMSAAQNRGLLTIGGRPMIEHQVAAQISFWRGDPISLEFKQ